MSRAVIAVCAVLAAASARGDQSAFGDFHIDHPGAIHHITAADLPAPFATEIGEQRAGTVPRPARRDAAGAAWLQRVAVRRRAREPAADSDRAERRPLRGRDRPGRIKVLRGRDASRQGAGGRGVRQRPRTVRSGLPSTRRGRTRIVYVGNTDSVVRFPYQVGRSQGARRRRESAAVTGGTFTRRRPLDARRRLLARRKKMFVGVGSRIQRR